MVALAITLQFILVAYHQLTTWRDFFPFNGARFYSPKEKAAEALSNLVLMTLGPVGFLLRCAPLMKFGAAYYFILFGVECATWWAPYFLGAAPKWQAIYDRIHRRTITVVPRRGDNPAPNLEHMILMALTVTAAFATLAAYKSLGLPLSAWWIAAIIGVVLAGGTTFQFCFQGRAKSTALENSST